MRNNPGPHEPFTIGTPDGTVTTISYHNSDHCCIGSQWLDGGQVVTIVPLPGSFYLRVSTRQAT